MEFNNQFSFNTNFWNNNKTMLHGMWFNIIRQFHQWQISHLMWSDHYGLTYRSAADKAAINCLRT